MKSSSDPHRDGAAEEAALVAFLGYLASPELGQKIRRVMMNPRPQALHEIAAAINFPPVVFRLAIVHLATVLDTMGEDAPPPQEERGGKAQLDALLKATPFDCALTEVVRRFASVTFQNRAVALAEQSSPRTVEEIATILGLQPASLRIEIGAALAELTGATVEIPLGADAGGAVMQMRPAERRVLN